ncbi:MAG: phosphate/phosphite/phosphonate ABC transporter substrate-binding protein [Verrucomicrobiota bacterium]|nr:phosphate/phosphite/phosphonate ABC transporter substrate-binding protein [Verrucomicrobiota bacterium]
MNTLIAYFKHSLLITASLVLGCAEPNDEASSSNVKKIIVALEPDKDPDAMLEDRAALESYLSEITGKTVEAIIPMSSAVIYEGLRNGTIDLAYLSATAAAKLIEQDIIDILLAELIDGKPFYQSYWITLKDAPYQNVAELKGQPIAFSSRTSTSGFLIPIWDLYTQGLIDLESGPEGFFGEGNVFYGTGYVSAAERVLRGEALAAAVSYYVIDKDKHLSKVQRERLRMLDSQGPVPSHVIVVRKGLSGQDQTALQAALIGMNTEASDLRDRIFGAELAPAKAETHLQTTLKALGISRTMQF